MKVFEILFEGNFEFNDTSDFSTERISGFHTLRYISSASISQAIAKGTRLINSELSAENDTLYAALKDLSAIEWKQVDPALFEIRSGFSFYMDE
ncbi:hypothetical protein [Erythrobacter sp. F6033]|uniref:hypothetical protein n=1 Tax=Erythrobacter sp. F6033 TaxID=2926401 RepID=UPI001FF3A647|nr:hypothetical protein [Erythrobacter sp. F6033]MCK0127530.1 hypothetical protein [Erythrobacter sp. F6033]